MGPGLQILPSSQGSQADPTVQGGPCIPWGQGAHGGPAVPAAELPGPGPPGLPPRGPCHLHCCQTGMGASGMFQEDQEVRLIQGALPGQGGPSRRGLQLGLGSPGCQGVQLTPLGLLGLEVPLQTYQAPALQALPSLPLAPGVRGQRLLCDLSPQKGQGQARSPHDNHPHSHRCNRRTLLGALCLPPHIPLPGNCQLLGGPGDLSAPLQEMARGWTPGLLPLHLGWGTGNQGMSP